MLRPPLRAAASAALVAVALVAACGDQPPAAPRPLAPDTSGTPSRQILYACGRWAGSAPPVATGLTVDVLFGVDAQFSGPTDSDLADLAAHGASLIYKYSFRAARVTMNTAEVPSLVDGSLARAVFSVPNPLQFDWVFILEMAGDLTVADSVYLVGLGGRDVKMLRAIKFITVDLPDASVATLVQWPRLLRAEPDGIGCVAGAA